MDQREKKPAQEFSETEFRADARRVMDHVATHGTAVIKNSDGRVRMFIHTPTTDLPPVDPNR